MIATILIVDDSEIDRQTYGRFLKCDRPDNYHILEAHTLSEARNLCEVEKPDAILVGFQLQDGNGLEVLKWMQQQESSQLPALMLIQQVDETAVAQTIKNLTHDYLVKDQLIPERLQRSLDNLLERKQLTSTISDLLRLHKQSEAALAKSENKFRYFVECTDDLIWATNLDGKFTSLSPQFKELFGWEPDQWLGRSIVDLVYPIDRIRFIAYFERILVSGLKEPMAIEFRHLQQDGSHVWVSSDMLPAKDSEGFAIGVQGVVRDISDKIALAHAISDRRQAERDLEEANKRLSFVNHKLVSAVQLKDRFLSTMSHELRTPLNPILGISELLQEEVYGSVNSRQKEALQIIEQSGSHLLELINDILDFSDAEVGYLELNCSPTSIKQICQASLEFVKPQASQKNIQLESEIEPDLPDVSLDERRIRQVLINILNNAIKFTSGGGRVTLAANLTTEIGDRNEKKSYIQISVIDTGIGIAPENINQIFQPFTQLDNALNRQYEGSGLGLAVVKQIVETHGGKVEVSSEIGVGSTFIVKLPSGD
ncbi:ATP-binding protein [Tumidithrix elongata RA019]|uniref:Circadian input-output histidine kinase CikA n=1 Tax=Tumidithrix elongata BACA0141 TaxID=2716417 RepID=A0AAW9Q357_9CYAN|nr:ATP-binding protein [Tumidithrix elongata RA019]